jgi:hypothetical protein
MPPWAADKIVFVTRRKDERLEFCVDLLIYEEGLSPELDLPGKDVIR